MAKTNLQIVSTGATSGKKMTTSITYINPQTDSAKLVQFGRKLNDLTTNNYGETNRTQIINVDTEQVPVDENAKIKPTLTFEPLNRECYWDATTNTATFTITTDIGVGAIFTALALPDNSDITLDKFSISKVTQATTDTQRITTFIVRCTEQITAAYPHTYVIRVIYITDGNANYQNLHATIGYYIKKPQEG